MSKEKVTVELDIEDAQEIANYMEKKASQIDWILDNRPPAKNKIAELDASAKRLVRVSAIIKKALHSRALENEKVVKINANRK